MSRRRIVKESIWVAAGGMFGALMRHGTNHLVPLLVGESTLITATAVENVAGSFLIGFLYILIRKRYDNDRNLSLFVLTGFVGSYTTYSGFMAEAFELLQFSPFLFLTYLFSQIITGIFAVWAGMYVGKKI